MKRSLKAAILATILLLSTLPAAAAAAITSTQVIPLDFTYYVPCANGGAGEYVRVTGEVYVTYTVTPDAGGGHHTTYHARTSATGVGLSSGDVYRVVNRATIVVNADIDAGVQRTLTGQSTLTLVAPGTDNNLRLTGVVHYTVDPAGTPRSVVSEVQEKCV